MASLFSSSLALGSQQRALFIALRARAGDGGSLMMVHTAGRDESNEREKVGDWAGEIKRGKEGWLFEEQLIYCKSTVLRDLALIVE